MAEKTPLPKRPLPKGPFTLWRHHGYEGWEFEDFATLEEAAFGDKYGLTWVVTKPVVVTVTEIDGKR
jgi:hypothetical protein